jgi:hypothetical protein
VNLAVELAGVPLNESAIGACSVTHVTAIRRTNWSLASNWRASNHLWRGPWPASTIV